MLFFLMTVSNLHAANTLSVNSAIQKILEANQNAKNYLEWNDSAWHPNRVLRSEIQNRGSGLELCDSLQKLTSDELSIFEESLENDSLNLPCKAKLVSKLQNEFRFLESDASDFEFITKPVSINVLDKAVLTDGGLSEGEFAITIDDGPHKTRTPMMLDILKRAGIKATFFTVGQNAALYPDLIRREHEEGHTVGTHTMSHADLRKLSAYDARTEVTRAIDTVAQILGEPPYFFRFPYGARNKRLQEDVREMNLTTFFWNIDSNDWKARPTSQIINDVLTQMKKEKKGVILFHDIQSRTIALFPAFLKKLAAMKITPVVFVEATRVMP